MNPLHTAVLSLAVCAAGAAVALAQDPTDSLPTPAPADTARPWAVGERYEYGVKFGIFNVGRAELEVVGRDTVRGVAVWHVRLVIRGGALGYDLVDTSESWFGVEDLVTRRFVRNSDEDGRHRSRRYEVFADLGYWVRNGTDTAETVADPLDDASFFFYVRSIPLEIGRTYTIPRYFVKDRNPVQVQVLQRQTIRVPAGRFNTIVLRPIFKSRGIFGQGGQAYVWLSDDATRIPVRIRGSMRIGTIEMSLRQRR